MVAPSIKVTTSTRRRSLDRAPESLAAPPCFYGARSCSERQASKRRPALVLSDPTFQQQSGYLLLAMVTSSRQSAWPMNWPIENLRSAWAGGQPARTASHTATTDGRGDFIRHGCRWGRRSARSGMGSWPLGGRAHAGGGRHQHLTQRPRLLSGSLRAARRADDW